MSDARKNDAIDVAENLVKGLADVGNFDGPVPDEASLDHHQEDHGAGDSEQRRWAQQSIGKPRPLRETNAADVGMLMSGSFIGAQGVARADASPSGLLDGY